MGNHFRIVVGSPSTTDTIKNCSQSPLEDAWFSPPRSATNQANESNLNHSKNLPVKEEIKDSEDTEKQQKVLYLQ